MSESEMAYAEGHGIDSHERMEATGRDVATRIFEEMKECMAQEGGVPDSVLKNIIVRHVNASLPQAGGQGVVAWHLESRFPSLYQSTVLLSKSQAEGLYERKGCFKKPVALYTAPQADEAQEKKAFWHAFEMARMQPRNDDIQSAWNHYLAMKADRKKEVPRG